MKPLIKSVCLGQNTNDNPCQRKNGYGLIELVLTLLSDLYDAFCGDASFSLTSAVYLIVLALIMLSNAAFVRQ